MRPLAAVRGYHYWSDRLVEMLWNDNVERMPYKIDVGANLSGFGVQGRQPESLQTKAARAQAVEELLADLTVRDFDYRGPVDYFSGRSQILLSSLRYPNTSDTGAVTLFAKIRGESGRRIALCLFGSASNVCNCQSVVPQWKKFGWTSSTNEGMELLLKCAPKAEQGEDSKRFWDDVAFEVGASREDICWNALNVCYGQGAYHGNDCRPWHRGYTIGHYKDAEWLARIYFSYEDTSLFDDESSLRVSPAGAGAHGAVRVTEAVRRVNQGGARAARTGGADRTATSRLAAGQEGCHAAGSGGPAGACGRQRICPSRRP